MHSPKASHHTLQVIGPSSTELGEIQPVQASYIVTTMEHVPVYLQRLSSDELGD